MFTVAFAVAFALPAFAAAVLSNWSYYGPVNGVTYENRSETNNNVVMTAVIAVRGKNSATMPAGWAALQGTLYRNGSACKTGDYYYTTSDLKSISRVAATKNCGTGNYTTRGSTGAYNGNDYDWYYTAKSPILVN